MECSSAIWRPSGADSVFDMTISSLGDSFRMCIWYFIDSVCLRLLGWVEPSLVQIVVERTIVLLGHPFHTLDVVSGLHDGLRPALSRASYVEELIWYFIAHSK